MADINTENAIKAYGCVKILVWLVLILLAGVVAGNFFGFAIGLAASLLVTLVMLVGIATNIEKALKAKSSTDEP